MKKRYVILVVLIFMIGLGVFAYPIISNYYNDHFQTRVIDEYQQEVNSRTDEEKERMRQEMEDYNKALATGLIQIEDPLSEQEKLAASLAPGADTVLDALDEEYGKVIGVLDVPGLNLRVPIYDGVSSVQLQRGVGVLPGTSLPVGGENTHSVITGHRGLPTAKLFTDLPEMKVGDVFFIEVLDEKLAYKVETIQIIEPIEIGELRIMPNLDVVTLLTCTPYMINTHRLIVSGYRIPYEEIIPEAIAERVNCWDSIPCWWIIAALAFALFLLVTGYILLILTYRKVSKIWKKMNKDGLDMSANQTRAEQEDDKNKIEDTKQ